MNNKKKLIKCMKVMSTKKNLKSNKEIKNKNTKNSLKKATK